MTVRVLIAEDQALVRAGLVTILGNDPEIEVVAEAADGLEAVDQALAHRPDVALLDVRMPRCDGITATRRILDHDLPTRVLVLTTFGEDDVVVDALHAGAQGFLLKDARPEDLLSAVHAVASGEARLDPAVTAAVIARVRRGGPRKSHPVDRLTDREREVLVLLAQGLSNAEVAERLVVSTGTVKTHVASTLAKLGARDRVQAVIAAFESGLVET
ncbi:MAG: response regulator [Mycobacteriales bacterium]